MTEHLCQCGCGSVTPISKQNHAKLGWVKGSPRPFVQGHHMRGRPAKHYRMVGSAKGCIFLHRQLAEKALGKPLPPKAVVHHVDGTVSSKSALVICQDEMYHKFLHVRMRVKQAGGDPNTERICYICKQVKPFDAFVASMAKRRMWNCSSCWNARCASYRLSKRAS